MASTYNNTLRYRKLPEHEVFAILDSKIQYQKFLINDAMEAFEVDDEGLSEDTPVMDNQVFELIESSNRNLHLLLFMRDRLEDWNTNQIFDLITDNKYLEYSEDEITISLQPKQAVESAREIQVGAR